MRQKVTPSSFTHSGLLNIKHTLVHLWIFYFYKASKGRFTRPCQTPIIAKTAFHFLIMAQCQVQFSLLVMRQQLPNRTCADNSSGG